MILLEKHSGGSEILDREENADILFLSAEGKFSVGIRRGKLLVLGWRKLDFEVLTGNAVLIDEKKE
jgi:hypothetical protein